jgi:hypothetical protein
VFPLKHSLSCNAVEVEVEVDVGVQHSESLDFWTLSIVQKSKYYKTQRSEIGAVGVLR